MSLARDWEHKLTPIVNKIYVEASGTNFVTDDGEFDGFVTDLLCELVEAIEDCSTFDADKQLYGAVRSVCRKKGKADLVAWNS